jgi:hypothetical protein
MPNSPNALSRLSAPALLVGSVPLADARAVLTMAAEELGEMIDAYPDGETGDRTHWVFYLVQHLYRGHPDLEMVHDGQGATISQPEPGQSVEGRAQSLVTFRLRKGVEKLRFDSLHYAAPAIESYKVFASLRTAGAIAAGARFQVALPATSSAVTSFFAEPSEWDVVYEAYQAAVKREIALMLDVIPADDLAIQFDIANEVRDLYAGDSAITSHAPDWPLARKWDWHLAGIEPLAAAVPDEAVLGYHLCFGTWGGWPHTPGVKDLGVCVQLANEIVARAPRPVDYIHMPVLPDADAAFFKPLSNLSLEATRLYFGLAYHDGEAGSRRRIAMIKQFVEYFGVAWYCGFGRLAADEVRPILKEIQASVSALQSA